MFNDVPWARPGIGEEEPEQVTVEETLHQFNLAVQDLQQSLERISQAITALRGMEN